MGSNEVRGSSGMASECATSSHAVQSGRSRPLSSELSCQGLQPPSPGAGTKVVLGFLSLISFGHHVRRASQAYPPTVTSARLPRRNRIGDIVAADRCFIAATCRHRDVHIPCAGSRSSDPLRMRVWHPTDVRAADPPSGPKAHFGCVSDIPPPATIS